MKLFTISRNSGKISFARSFNEVGKGEKKEEK